MEESQLQPQPRNTFITILCVLTFIGSGWGILSNIMNYVNANSIEVTSEAIEESMDEAMEQIQDSDDITDKQKGLIEKIMNGVSEVLTPANVRKSSLISILSGLLCIFGAVLMWNLRKVGFYVYIGGILLVIIGMIVIFGPLMGAISAFSAAFGGFIMTILYGVNLKHMN
ncbi:MAG: hypothetical protein COA58_12700 [Bacteroidetes bacterium]|nr:MAG: hypothetical protein COA58_12700 [Bacteroidota bacterium]